MPLGLENVDPQKNKDYYRQMMDAEVDAATLIGAIKKGEDDFQIVDVRDEESYNKGHIKGAINIQLDELSNRMKDLDKDKGVLTYCYDPPCMLSVKAARILSDQGFKVKDIGGGFENYQKNEGPVEKGTAELTH